jgi:two-component system chemotaxis response regulator CheY
MALHILVVDDARSARLMACHLLKKAGARVSDAAGGADALAILAGSDPPDAVLIDTFMPEMDGVTLVRAIRADPALGDLPLIVVSAANEPGQIDEARRAGADAFLTKPLDAPTVLDTLRPLVERRRQLCL